MYQTTNSSILEKLKLPALVVDEFTLLVKESNFYFDQVRNCKVMELCGQFGILIDDIFIQHVLNNVKRNGYCIETPGQSENDNFERITVHANQLNDHSILIYFSKSTPFIYKSYNSFQENDNSFGRSSVKGGLINEITQNVKEGIGILDENFDIVYCNKSFADIFDKDVTNILGENILILCGKDNQNKIQKEFLSNKTNKVFSFDIRLELLHSREKYIQIRSKAKFGLKNEYLGSFISLSDVSDIVHLERELVLSQEKVKETEQLKATFLANMSHEVRTPMNSIIGFSTLLKNSRLTKEKRDKYLNFIITHGKKLMDLIADIIDLSILEEHQANLVMAPLNLNTIINEVEERGLRLIEESDKELHIIKSCFFKDDQSFIYSDALRIKQIYNYLINNAVKFSTDGIIEFGYRIDDANTMLLFVRDSGIGIPLEMHEIIFERFRQVDESFTRTYGGTGMGLTICQELVKLLGGKIWVESNEIKGSTFYFTVPYYPYMTTNTDENLQISGISELWANRQVLVIEDDVPSSEFLNEILTSKGCKVFQAFSGKEGLSYFDANEFDLVLLDIQLPEMDGFEIAERIRHKNSTIPIIAQTARAFSEIKTKCMESGCTGYLTKPITYERLVKTLSEFLDRP